MSNPSASSKKPKGSRITLGGENKVAKSVSGIRGRQNSKAGRINQTNARRRLRDQKVNERREKKAFKKGNTVEKTRKIQISPATSTTVKGKTTTTTGTKFVSNEVRAGDSKSFGKERAKSTPTPNKTGNRGERLQYALQEGRKAGKTTIMFDGKEFAAGKNVATSKTTTSPDVTTNTPAKFKNVTETKAVFKKKNSKKRRIKIGASVNPSNARVKKVKTTLR